ncbi:MAG: signal peptidase I [Chloroflexi bacterium]|nr:signal peptidase I [Chloroflexota bacterium]
MRLGMLAVWYSVMALTLAIAGAIGAVIVLVTFGNLLLINTGQSMDPAIPAGALIVVDPRVDPTVLQPGDVITFAGPAETIITHRIVAPLADDRGLGFSTRGDANPAADPEIVRPPNVVGRVWLHVPLVGYLFQYVREWQSATVLGPLLLLAGFVVAHYWLAGSLTGRSGLEAALPIVWLTRRQRWDPAAAAARELAEEEATSESKIRTRRSQRHD